MNSIKKISKLCCLFLLILSFGCDQHDKSADIYSYQIPDKIRKLEKLREYFTKESGLIDVAYHIWYQDNGNGLLAGPSDYRIRMALKLEPDSIDSWVEGLEHSKKLIAIENWQDLKLDESIWNLESTPELYHSQNMTEVKIVYRKEHVILATYSTAPIALDWLNE